MFVSSEHHPDLPQDGSGPDNPKQFDLTALLSRDFGMLSSDDSRNLYISVTLSKKSTSIVDGITVVHFSPTLKASDIDV